jgi:hypothetical protein|tara:strand:+ start:447 stop:596 length:150 start_codon:yes stop_codon:yes gene_type:complete
MLADEDLLKIDKILDTNVWEMHTFLAHKLDKQKLEASIRRNQGNNDIEL